MTCRIDRLTTEDDGVILRIRGCCVGAALDVLRDTVAEGHGVGTLEIASSENGTTVRAHVSLVGEPA